MKKTIAVVIAVTTLFFYGVTNSMAEWTAGISVSHGEYSASGQENRNGSITHANDMAAKEVTYPTIFFEKAFDYASVGISIIPATQESEEASRTDYNCTAGIALHCTGNDGSTGSVTNTAKVQLSQHVTLYTIVPIMAGAFARAGIQTVLVETDETLNTGSKYDDKRIVGGTIGLGYQHDTGGGFVRIEAGYSRYNTLELTSTTNSKNKVTADLDGSFGRLSIGRSF